jgi:hypothetical protein
MASAMGEFVIGWRLRLTGWLATAVVAAIAAGLAMTAL